MNKYSKSWEEGLSAENEFLDNPAVTLVSKSNRGQDINEHWDFLVSVECLGRLKVDIKGRKRNRRGDSDYMPEQWIELKNVHGRAGWAIPNEVTNRAIAFQSSDEWIICFPEHLVNLCNSNEGYERRTRKGRKDVIVKAPIADIKRIAELVLPIAEPV